MKHLVKMTAMAAVALSVAFTSCDDDDDDDAPTTGAQTKSGIITEDETWTSNNIYTLQGKVVIDGGATLTIQPGTIIKGASGEGVNASALVIAQGAKIMAQGTADKPIIFTSAGDGITVGQKESTLNRDVNELWGGLVILGNAPISAGDGDDVANIEGIPAEEGYGAYGGAVPTDNSGTLQYVSIRHGGADIADGNELNALTLGGVGTGTTIENVEIYATLDDGIEFFGGTVNVTNALVYFQGDDGIDIDQNYSGTVNNFAVIHGDGISTDEGLEIDGPEGTLSDGLFTLSNGTVKTVGTEGSAGDFKSKAQGTVTNVKFEGYATSTIKVRASYQNDCQDTKTDSWTYLTDATPTLVFNNNMFDAVSVYTGSKNDDESADCAVPATDQTAAEQAVGTQANGSAGADMSVFTWTNAGLKGQL